MSYSLVCRKMALTTTGKFTSVNRSLCEEKVGDSELERHLKLQSFLNYLFWLEKFSLTILALN